MNEKKKGIYPLALEDIILLMSLKGGSHHHLSRPQLQNYTQDDKNASKVQNPLYSSTPTPSFFAAT